MTGLRYFRNIFFALAAFLWLPAAAHCQLETVPGLKFLHCAADGQNAKGTCDDCGCCAVEKSQYHSEQNHFTLSTPALLPALHPSLMLVENSLPTEVSVGVLTAAPPQLLQARHFISRTSLPVRAPSIAS
jgi:hypothetical protein